MTDSLTKRSKVPALARFIMLNVGVMAPLMILYIARLLSRQRLPLLNTSENTAYIIFAVAVLYTALTPVWLLRTGEPVSIRLWHQGKWSRNPDRFYIRLVTVRSAMVCAPYCFALFMFLLLRHNWWFLLTFFAIGAGWLVFLWPRQSQYEAFMKRYAAEAEGQPLGAGR